MTSFLSTFAVRHFDEHPRQSLLAGLASRIDGRNVAQALGSGCRALQHLAWRRMTELPESELALLIERALAADGAELPAMLSAISHESVALSEAIIEQVVSLMESSRAEVRRAAANLVALRQPSTAIPLLRRGGPIDRDVLRRLCLADDPSLVLPLMSAFGFPQQVPPPTIGFVVTPSWLSEQYAREPNAVEWLIRQCGYCDDGVTPEVLELLSMGFSYVTPRMTGEPRLTKVAHRWQRRMRAFVWRLLPDELDLERGDTKPFDANNPLEVDLFLAAVRDSDRMLFLEQKSRPPFSRASGHREPAPVCFHASARFVRRKLYDEPLAQAERGNIPHDRRGDFLLEAARVLLEPNDEVRTAADLALRGRWLSLVEGRAMPPRTLVIGNFEPLPPNNRLSPGADSVKNLAAACGLNTRDIADWLADAESRWSRCLVPMGIEVQIPRIDPNRFAAWKEALPFLGVPSPNRREFGGMIEAAFRPARSFHALVVGPLLLCRLGLFTEPQDMALHVSLQGELNQNVRSLAFPHLFIHPSHRLRNRPDWSMARVMSKGFVHVHDDAETLCEDGGEETRRTELRLFRIFAESQQNRIELTRGFVSDLVAVHVLGSALVSPCHRCRALFNDYASAIEQTARELASEFQQLLAANYFESTGDPRDEGLLKLLPIFRCWSSVREIVRSRDLASSLDLHFRALRHRHILSVLEHWADEHDLRCGELTVTDDEIELALQPDWTFA